MRDRLLEESLKMFFVNPTVVLYIMGPVIFLVFFIAVLHILVKWSDSY